MKLLNVFGIFAFFLCFCDVFCDLCKRPGHYCKNGGTLMGGMCRCQPDYFGYDCAIFKPMFCAIDRCENGGFCYDNSKCHCPCGFYGDRCEYKTEFVKCGPYSMTVDIAMPPSGDLEVYAMPYPKCLFQISGHVGGRTVYSLELNRTSSRSPECQSAMVESRTNSTPTYAITAHVRNSAGYETPSDWSLKFECIYPSKGTSSVRDVTKEKSPIDFAFTDAYGNRIKRISPATPFNIIFHLKKNSGYRTVKLDYLAVRNQTTGDKVFTYLKDGIVPLEARMLQLINGPGQELEEFLIDSTKVNSTRLSLTGLNETSLVYMDYKIWVCETTICPEKKRSDSNTFLQKKYTHWAG